MAKEVLIKNDAAFCGRTAFTAMTVLNHNDTSVAFSAPNAHWRDLRKICKSYLFSKDRLDATQGVRRRQVQQLLTHVQDCCDTNTPINISKAVFDVYLNFISSTFFSKDLADPNVALDFWELVSGMLHVAGIPNIADYFPILKMVDPQGIGHYTSDCYQKATGWNLEGKKLSDKKGDMLDVLLDAIKENEDTNFKEFELPNLLLWYNYGTTYWHLQELIVGGTDTTWIILEWALSELLRNPVKLEKAQEELDNVVGKGKPIEDHIDCLPYLQAIVKETFRLHPPVPFLVP
ncbi:Drimenol monooxygenase-like protein [Drosera capensis]